MNSKIKHTQSKTFTTTKSNGCPTHFSSENRDPSKRDNNNNKNNNSNNNDDDDKYLGLVNKRFLKTFHGIIHGLGSTIALVLGNIMFVNRVFLGTQSYEESHSELVFHVCNFVASLTTAIFFWNKVQSWQVSTTTMKEKGFTPQMIQRFNQGRGVVTMLLFSLYPLVCRCLPEHILEHKGFSTGLGLTLIAGSATVYNLVKDCGKVKWLIYGWTPMALGISIIFHGTVASMHETYPMVIDRFQKEASFVISCVQMGFMMYYLYSRNLVTKRTVQKICKTYHVTLLMVIVFRSERDFWLQLTGSTDTAIATTTTTLPATPATGGTLPWPMMIQPTLLTLSVIYTLLSLIIKKLWAMGVYIHSVSPPLPSKGLLPSPVEETRIQLFQHPQRQAKNITTESTSGRRSSLSSQIESATGVRVTRRTHIGAACR